VKRRELLLLGAALTAARALRAQQMGKPHRIGNLPPAEQRSAKTFEAFRSGLRDLGYVDGANIVIEYRLAAGDYSRLPAMAAELVRLPVDIIVTDTQRPRRSRERPRGRSRSSWQPPAQIRWRRALRRASRILAATLPALAGSVPNSAASGYNC